METARNGQEIHDQIDRESEARRQEIRETFAAGLVADLRTVVEAQRTDGDTFARRVWLVTQ